jgi:HEAT repeat protein
MDSAAKTAVPALAESLKEKGPVCWAAARALGQIGPEAKAAIPALTRALQDTRILQDTNEEVRKTAAEALESIKNDKQ